MSKENSFLYAHGGRIQSLVKEFEGRSLLGSFEGDTNYSEVIILFNGLINEIERLQKENNLKK